MPSKVDDQIPRSVMFLCLGTAAVLLLVQWGSANGLFSFRHPHMGIVRGERRVVLQNGATANAATAIAAPTVSSPAPPSPVVPKTDARLVVSLSERHVTLYKGDKAQAIYPLAVAQAGWETPTGTFQVLNKETNPIFVHPITGEEIPPGVDNPLGVAWIGFWTDGESEIGFHGTNQEELIGEAVSHGCLRMRNADIQAIYAQVSAGTPVVVQQ
jgi:hypothetical protein